MTVPSSRVLWYRISNVNFQNPKIVSIHNLFLDQLSMIRPDLIRRISPGVFGDLVLRLESYRPPVLISTEKEVIMHRSPVLQDQVTSLIDAVLKKGDRACEVMLSLLKELDHYLSEDLGL